MLFTSCSVLQGDALSFRGGRYQEQVPVLFKAVKSAMIVCSFAVDRGEMR